MGELGLRRLRNNPILRRMIRETELRPDDLVMPYFVRPGKGLRKPIASMPGMYQFSIDQLVSEVKKLRLSAVLLFGIPQSKDARGSGAYAKNGIIQKAVRALKKETDLLVIGMPTEGTPQDEGSPLDDDLIEVLLREDLRLLRRSECSLLVVCRPPGSLGAILVNYQGGLEGKRALGMAGELAERTGARIVVLSIEGDAVRAAELTGTAREYLGGFDLPSVDTIEEKGVPDSEEKILERAETEGADGITIHRKYLKMGREIWTLCSDG